MILEMQPCVPQETARQLSPLTLAYIGDGVHTLLTRASYLDQKLKVNDLHRLCTDEINAHAQCRALARIQVFLTEEEKEMVRRGRNAHPHHNAPHSASVQEYSAATALETLYGYLFITGQGERLEKLFSLGRESRTEPCPEHN